MVSLVNKKIVSIPLLFLFFVLFLLPFLVSAQGTAGNGSTGSGDTGITYECPPTPKKDSTGKIITGADGKPILVYGECGFADLINAVERVVRWGTGFALGFSVVVIAWAGFNYMISGDNPSKRSSANKTLRTAVIGIALIVGAWLIVELITSALLNEGIDTFLG